jgi:hypothetical protein
MLRPATPVPANVLDSSIAHAVVRRNPYEHGDRSPTLCDLRIENWSRRLEGNGTNLSRKSRLKLLLVTHRAVGRGDWSPVIRVNPVPKGR